MNRSPAAIQVTIDPSQFPDPVRSERIRSLRTRQVNHQFLYDSLKQTEKWLAVHRSCSPFYADVGTRAIYDAGAEAAARLAIPGGVIHVLGLGCGHGAKDLAVIRSLLTGNSTVFYTPCDVSLSMALLAHQAAAELLPPTRIHAVVCDLPRAVRLRELCAAIEPAPALRIVTFFGLLPNFTPAEVQSILDQVARPGDWLLISANLAPGPEYATGVRRVLPLYENDLTRDWLLTWLLDLGCEEDDGVIRFVIENCPHGSDLKRISAHFEFTRDRILRVDDHAFEFRRGEVLRLFFSYRHTVKRLEQWLTQIGYAIAGQWVAPTEEEGVFLSRRVSLEREADREDANIQSKQTG